MINELWPRDRSRHPSFRYVRPVGGLPAEEYFHLVRASGNDVQWQLTLGSNRMNYAKARQHGRPIGSGNVEATCKTLQDSDR